MNNTARRSDDTVRDGEEDTSSIDINEKRAEPMLGTDEEKTIRLEGPRGDRGTTHGEHSGRAVLPEASSLRPTKSHRSYGGEDGYTCFSEDDSAPNNSSRATEPTDPFLVSWDGGDADPSNPRSMTKARRWAITLIVSASSLCVYVIWFWVTRD